MLYTNAGTCAKQVDLALAESYLRAALAQDPQFPDALFQMADVSLERGNALQARGFLERYLAQGKPTPAALWLGVRIEQSLNDATAARKYGDAAAQGLSRSPTKRACCSNSPGRRADPAPPGQHRWRMATRTRHWDSANGCGRPARPGR